MRAEQRRSRRLCVATVALTEGQEIRMISCVGVKAKVHLFYLVSFTGLTGESGFNESRLIDEPPTGSPVSWVMGAPAHWRAGCE